MPNITDLFSKAADDSKSYPVVATVIEAREAGGKTLKLDSLVGWNTTTPVHFMSYSKKDGVIDLASQSDWKGLVVDNTIAQLTLTRGVDNGHKMGDQIVLNPTAGWLDDLIGGLGVTLNPDGSLKDSIVKTSNIDWPSVIQKTDINQLTYMQDFSKLNQLEMAFVIKSMVEEQVYTLKDKRDGTPYKIALLKDGNVWMVEEFKGKGFTCHPNDSNVSDNYTLPENSLSNFKGTTPALYESNEGYVFYNTYCALADGKGDIAPLGWEMPPQTYWDNFISKNTNYFEPPINIVRKGVVQAGSSGGIYSYPWHNSSQTESDGVYWSSTPHQTSDAVQLGLWVRGADNNLWAGNSFSNKNYGALLRFVLKRSSNL